MIAFVIWAMGSPRFNLNHPKSYFHPKPLPCPTPLPWNLIMWPVWLRLIEFLYLLITTNQFLQNSSKTLQKSSRMTPKFLKNQIIHISRRWSIRSIPCYETLDKKFCQIKEFIRIPSGSMSDLRLANFIILDFCVRLGLPPIHPTNLAVAIVLIFILCHSYILAVKLYELLNPLSVTEDHFNFWGAIQRSLNLGT